MQNFVIYFPWAIFFARLVIALVIFTIHELGHAIAATLLGDPTPREEGRLTLDPRRHWEHIGGIIAILIGVGWSRPTHFQAHKMRVNDALGGVITVLAGLLANVICVIAGLAAMNLLGWQPGMPFRAFPTAAQWLTVFIKMNLALVLINLLPLFPLDGHALIQAVLPLRMLPRWQIVAGKTALILGIGLVFVMLMPTAWMSALYWPVIRTATSTFLGW
jgi:Zn-dependent protease